MKKIDWSRVAVGAFWGFCGVLMVTAGAFVLAQPRPWQGYEKYVAYFLIASGIVMICVGPWADKIGEWLLEK